LRTKSNFGLNNAIQKFYNFLILDVDKEKYLCFKAVLYLKVREAVLSEACVDVMKTCVNKLKIFLEASMITPLSGMTILMRS
jgi:hypothetical protein